MASAGSQVLSLCPQVLSTEEYESISEVIRSKIETFVRKIGEEQIVATALLETNKCNSAQLIATLEQKVSLKEEECHDLKTKLETTTQELNEIKGKWQELQSEAAILKDQLNRLETENNAFRLQRNSAIDERDDLLKIVERRNSEMNHLQEDYRAISQQLQAAISAKCEALVKSEEVESHRLDLEFKEKRMEGERERMTREIDNLTSEVNRLTDEVVNIRRENTTRRLTLEAQLHEKTEELKIAQQSMESMEETNNKLQEKLEDSVRKLMAEHENLLKLQKTFDEEITQQTKLCELYRGMSDDAVAKAEKFEKAVKSLQDMIREAVEQNEKTEIKMKVLQEEYERKIEDKHECIETLRKELQSANDLIQVVREDRKMEIVGELSPSAANLMHLFNSRMSLTQIYLEMKNMSEELIKEKQENKRLNEYIDEIIQQIEQKAPELQKLRDDYAALKEDRDQLCQNLDAKTRESEVLDAETQDLKNFVRQYKKEIETLEKERSDLSHQVCHLLQENQNLRLKPDVAKQTIKPVDLPDLSQVTERPLNASDIITDHLLKFSSIQQLQLLNSKLIALVRELSKKAEEEENEKKTEGKETYEELKTLLNIRTKELEEYKAKQCRYTRMMERAMQQLEYYKSKSFNRDNSSNDSRMEEDPQVSKIPEKHSTLSNSAAASCDIHEEEIKELTEKLENTEKSLQEMQEEFDTYRTERQTNEQILTEQLETMRDEIRALRTNCSKMTSQLEYSEERFKIMQVNCNTYKNQITALESKNKTYNTTIVKQEQTLNYLQDELINTQKKLSKTEVAYESAQRETALLKDAESRLQREREALQREKHGQAMLLANLDTIRAGLERSEVEGRARLESRLDESFRECSALRRRLQEEQDRFRELSNHVERQLETAKNRLEEETQQVCQYKEQLDVAKEELAKAKSEIDDLKKKVGDSVSVLRIEKKDVDVSALEKKLKDLLVKLKCMETELKGTQELLSMEKEHSKQFSEISGNLEGKLTETLEEYNNYKITSEKRITEFMQNEEELMKKASALEGKLSSLQTGSTQSSAELSIQLQKSQEELSAAQQELDKIRHDLTNARMEIATLTASVQAAEDKYAHEVVLHSADLQNFLTVKKELSEISGEVKELKAAKVNAEQALEQGREKWTERETKLQTELTETQKRIEDLDSHNAKLHEQLEELSSKIALMQAQGVMPSPNTSLTEDSGNISLNTSLCEEEVKSIDQLMQIIKYLRKEKNILVSRCDVLKAENLRITSQLEIIKKQFDEAKNALNEEKEKSDVAILTTSKHTELLRKLETYSAITDSNRMLRSERDALQAQVKELQLRVESLEQELTPMRDQNRDLVARVDSLDAENTALRTEARRLRQRINFLIERSSKTSPEDWRRLQQERETLARQVSTDRETIQRKDEEARTLRQEKTRLEEQINLMTRQFQQQTEELRRQGEELNTVQQRLNKIAQELNESKNVCTKKNDELAKITEDLGAKEALLTDARNKEFQIRKIAKKYKTQWEDLTKTSEEDKKKIEELTKSLSEAQVAATTAAQSADITQEAQEQLREEGRRELESRIVEVETRHSDRVKELEGQVTSSHEKAETLRKENDSLKSTANEKEERAKAVLKTARQKIMQLTESKTALQVELDETKGRLQIAEQGKEEDTVRMSALKSQYENRIARLEKENADLRSEKQHEMEAMNQRVNQLQRQLDKFQGSKPSTSSGTGDKTGGEPPTANIKPMAGPSSSGVKQAQSQQSVTVTPWAGRGDTPFASIRPISMQSRTVAVLPTSQSASSTLSPATPVLVPPQQQLVHTTGSGSGSGPEGLSSSPTSSHTDYIPMPATSSASSGSSVVRQVAVPPTVTTVSPSTREEPPQSAQSMAESTQDMEAEPAISDASPQAGTTQPQQQQQHRQQPDHISQLKVEPQLQQQVQQQQSQPLQQQQQPQQQQQSPLPQSQAIAGTSQQITQTVAPSAPQQGQQAVAMVLPRVEQQPTAPLLSGQSQQVEQAAAAPSSQASSSSNTVTTSQAGVGGKRTRDSESEGGDEEGKAQGKRSRLAGSGQQDMFPASSDSVLEVEYQVPTSSQRDQEDEMVDSEDEEGIADEGVIEEPDDGQEFEDDDNGEGYAVERYRDVADLTSFEEVEGPDIDEENPADQESNEAEIMDDSNEVPNQSGTDSPARPAGDTSSRSPSAPQQHAEASSSGTSSSSRIQGDTECVRGIGASRVASSVMGFGRGPARSVPPLSRQQQQSQLLLGYEESGDDSIVPSTPTLFVPRRSDGFGEAVSSPQVPQQSRFTFSDANPPATRTVSQGAAEGIDDNRMDLNQLEEAGTGRSVPTTPPQVSPQEMSSEVGQSEGGSEEAVPQNEAQPEASGSQTTVPSITVTEASEEETGDAGEEMPPPELTEYDETTEQRDTSEEQEQEESLELADEGGDGVSSEGEKSQPLEEVEEGREAEATEAGDNQEALRRMTRAANIARRSARNPFRNQRGRGGMRPTPIIWNEPGSSMGNQPPRGRALLMPSMRGSPNDPMRGNFPRGSQRARRTRGKGPKGGFSSPYQLRF